MKRIVSGLLIAAIGCLAADSGDIVTIYQGGKKVVLRAIAPEANISGVKWYKFDKNGAVIGIRKRVIAKPAKGHECTEAYEILQDTGIEIRGLENFSGFCIIEVENADEVIKAANTLYESEAFSIAEPNFLQKR